MTIYFHDLKSAGWGWREDGGGWNVGATPWRFDDCVADWRQHERDNRRETNGHDNAESEAGSTASGETEADIERDTGPHAAGLPGAPVDAGGPEERADPQ